ncbi:hypothetical protein MBLNU230_g4504t1 [Neophaeotheca triangularis]
MAIPRTMTIISVDEEPPAPSTSTGLETKCPMCRTQTSAIPDGALASQLRQTYPKLYTEREAEETRNPPVSLVENIQPLTLAIGNRHSKVSTPNNVFHYWTFFVTPNRTDIIEEVQILLHPTFRPSKIIRQRPPYKISRRGWGTFVIVAAVILKAGFSWVSDEAEDSPDGAAKGMLRLEWELDFRRFGGKGSMGVCELRVRSDGGWEGGREGFEDEVELGRMRRQYEMDGRYEPEE